MATLEHMSIEQAQNLGKEKVTELLKLDNLYSKNDQGNTTDEVKEVNNSVTASKMIDIYGIRQEIVTQNSYEDPKITALRKLNDNCKPKEEIEVECIGDVNYKVGYGVRVVLPFLPKYNDCYMYIKEVSNEWKGEKFISTLTLTPSRVMDEQEWSDDKTNEETKSSNSETVNKIITLLKQQLGKPYVWGANDPSVGFDCSGLMYYCYNQFSNDLIDGKPIGRTTYEQVKNGKEIGISDQSLWEVGDLIFPHAGHVVAWLGEGKVIQAPHTGDVVKISDYNSSYSNTYAVRRVIDSNISADMTQFGVEGIPDSYNSNLIGVESNCSTFISNMKKYGFKEDIKSISQDKGVNPYITASIIAIESEGNPYCGGTYYGLMQVAGGSSDSKTNIEQGLNIFNNKKAVVGSQIHVILSAYNSGEGTVLNASKASSLDLKTCTIKEMGDALYSYVSSHYSNWDANEKKYYASKVLKAYTILYKKEALS